MPNDDTNVKEYAGRKPMWLRWVDGHPRTGWYICTLVTLDFVLQLLEVFRCPMFH